VYVRKHGFCSNCSKQVFRAFDLLMGYTDRKEEPGYAPDVYCGLTPSHDTHSFCVSPDPDILSNLMGEWTRPCACPMRGDRVSSTLMIMAPSLRVLLRLAVADRAVPDCTVERHTKCMRGAQEEVVTCLGNLLWQRLGFIWLQMRTEELSRLQLMYLSGLALRQSFDLAVDRKQGIAPGDVSLLFGGLCYF